MACSTALAPSSPTSRRARTAGDWRIADAESLLGELLAAEGRYAEAEACLLAGYRVLRSVHGEEAIYTREARHRVTRLLRSLGTRRADGTLTLVGGHRPWEPRFGAPMNKPL